MFRKTISTLCAVAMLAVSCANVKAQCTEQYVTDTLLYIDAALVSVNATISAVTGELDDASSDLGEAATLLGSFNLSPGCQALKAQFEAELAVLEQQLGTLEDDLADAVEDYNDFVTQHEALEDMLDDWDSMTASERTTFCDIVSAFLGVVDDLQDSLSDTWQSSMQLANDAADLLAAIKAADCGPSTTPGGGI